jgi:hypothetical protein
MENKQVLLPVNYQITDHRSQITISCFLLINYLSLGTYKKHSSQTKSLYHENVRL